MDSTDIYNFDDTLKQMSEKVNQITGNTEKNSKPNLYNVFLSKVTVQSPLIYYGVVPIIIAVVLLFWKPGFVMEEVSINGNLPEKKFSFKKFLVSTLLFTTVISIIIFIYFYKSKDSNELALTT